MASEFPGDRSRGSDGRGAGRPARGRPGAPQVDPELIRQYVAEIVSEKLNEHAAKVTAKAERHLESFNRLQSQIDALDVWTRAEPGARKPKFSRDEIAAAAIRIADADGFDAVSMRRIAADLGAGTMTLYHYVRTKDELLTLVTDAVMGEIVLPEDQPLPDHWRDGLTVLAHRSRAAVTAHPWILDIHDDPPIGPNSVRHFDQSYGAVAALPLTLAQKLELIMAVDEYVFGYCLHERNNHQPGDEGTTPEMHDYLADLIATGGYPQLSSLVETYGFESAWEQIGAASRDDGRFDRNLSRLLDGFEHQLGLEAR